MPDDSEQPTQILSGAPTPPRGGTAMLEPHEPRLSDGGPGGTVPPNPPTGYGGGGGGDDWDGGDDEGGDRRIAALAAIIGILVVVVLFLVLRPGDDSETSTVATTPAAQAATPTPTAEPTATPQATNEATPTPEPTPTPTPEAPEASGPTLQSGSVTKFKVTQGDVLSFQVRNDGDAAQEVHVHGYDKEFDVEPGETRAISFPANLTGIFEIELHGTNELIGEVTVEP